MSSYDVIVIGSGAGGGTLVHRLAPSGKRILLLERGDWLPREPQNWSAADVFVDNRYISDDTWYVEETAKAFQPQVHYFVGGATKLYGAALYRLREEDFGELRHHDGVSPAWPIGYDELEPYYTQAEQLYQVHGARGEDPTEPPASAPYPFPAVSHEPRIQQLADDLAAAGPPSVPRALRRHAQRGGHGARRLRPLLHLRRLSLPGAREVGRRGARGAAGARASERHAAAQRAGAGAAHQRGGHGGDRGRGRASTGARETFSADIVVVSCGAANSAKLLLASATDKHPNGLSNRSDQLGRNYTFHNSQAVLALSKEENPTVFQKTLGLNDFYFGSDDYEYPLGNIQMVGKSSAPMFRGEKPLETKLAPTRTLESTARHAVDFWLSTEDLPRPENRVTLDGMGTFGSATSRPTRSPRSASTKSYGRCSATWACTSTTSSRATPISRTTSRSPAVPTRPGTCRFGTDPETSVLDTDCRAHELDNLYVVDTSFFPSIGAVNPALTAMANALRVGRPPARAAGGGVGRRRGGGACRLRTTALGDRGWSSSAGASAAWPPRASCATPTST